jgi:uncharacterized protein (DUF1330 family)
MHSLVIVAFNILKEEKFKEYSAAAAPTVASFGGEFIAKGKPTQLHGDNTFAITAVIKFPDNESAKNWYNSNEYQQIIPLRSEAMDCHFQLIG